MSAPTEKREHFAKIRREVVLHRMATAESVEDQMFWGIILWSWSGPEKSVAGAVVLKDRKGYIRKNNQGNPIPAKLSDLRELMGWPPTSKALVTRIIKRLIQKKSITFDKKAGILYAVDEPSLPEIPKVVAGTGNWCIGRQVVGTGNLPTDPVARKKAVLWLEAASTAWKHDLKSLRTRYRDMLVQASPGLGILYVLKEKKSRGEEESSSSAFSVAVAPYQPNAEEEDSRSLYERFKAVYPAAHFDEPKAKLLFEGKTLTQQATILERLEVYLPCPRWQDDNGRWIPLASTWLRSYDADPPPVVKPANTKSATRAASDAFFAEVES